MPDALRTAVIGMGLIGRRRAEVASKNRLSRLVAVSDSDPGILRTATDHFGVDGYTNAHDVLRRDDIEVVVVATPNKFLAPISVAALERDKHVLLEKPMGRNLQEASAIAEAAGRTSRLTKVGFNHRYHPALLRMKTLLAAGDLGSILNARAVYGHGGRPGYEKEWRGSPDLAGGGEATDQGVHIFDLLHWLIGKPKEAFACLQTSFWPLGELEDNAFGLLRYPSGAVASFHTSWTIWKNRFSLEIYCEDGACLASGLGKSYGIETLTTLQRPAAGGAPKVLEETFEEPDMSWQDEWQEFMSAITAGGSYMGTPEDGLVAMKTLDASYRSAQSNSPIIVA